MVGRALLILSLALFFPSAPAQTPPTETQTNQALLEELRQLRQDLQLVTGAARKAQILIYRLYLQGAAVERASEHLDAAKSALAQSEAQNRYAAEELKTYEEMRDSLDDAARRKQLEDVILRFKTNLEVSVAEQQELRTKEIALEDELRIEQAKLDRLQEELERLDKALEISETGPRKGER